MKSDGGQSSFSVLLTQDIAVIPILALVPLLAMPDLMDVGMTTEAHGGVETHATDTHSADAHAEEAHGDAGHGPSLSLVDGRPSWQVALITLGAIGVVIAGGSLLTRPVFLFIAMAGLRELFVATALLMVVGIALLMTVVGLSPALGTFLAGVVLANSEYRHELESDIDPFRGLLLGLFFMTVGAAINFGLLFENLALILALTIGLLVIKGAILYILGTIFGLRASARWLLTLGLAQAGEFGFVLLSFTVANSVIPTSVSDLLLLVIALSMLLTPALFILYDKVIAPRYVTSEVRETDEVDAGQIIIAGFGRVGGLVDRILRAAGENTTVIDYSAQQIDNMRTFGAKVFYGDATRPDLLAAAGIADAKVLVIALDHQEQITELVRYARHNYPNLHVVARATNRHHVYELWEAGCRDIIRENFDSSVRMGRSVLEAIGVDRPRAQSMVDAFVAMDRSAMVEVAQYYRSDVPVMENQEYIDKVKEIRGPWEDELSEEMSAIRNGKVTDEAS